MKRLRFWPDYTGALLWSDDGERVALEDVGLPRELTDRATRWIADYEDSKLPWEPTRDDDWLSEGTRLFAELRLELLELSFDLQVDEDYWAPRSPGEGPRPANVGEPDRSDGENHGQTNERR
jgi:hypothetical protein